MYEISTPEEFNLCVTLIMGAIKLQNKVLVKSCEETLIFLLGSECTVNIFTIAVLQLSETNPDLCRWALQNSSDLNTCEELVKCSMWLATNTLLKKGFVLGQDFSVTHTHKMLITQEAKVALMEDALPSDQILLEEILLSIDELNFI